MGIALLLLNVLPYEIKHGPHNYVANDIFSFAVLSGSTKILPIEKCIIFLETPYTYTLSSEYVLIISCSCYSQFTYW